MTLALSNLALKAAQEDAIKRFPQEACGLIVKGEYISCTNIAKEPEKDFEIHKDIVTPYIIAGTLEAVIHSHPYEVLSERSSPSRSDMQGQIATNVPWGIIDTDGKVVNKPYWWGDFILDTEIIGQEFHHGIHDCYAVIRKWYWQELGIILKEFPRDDKWWTVKEDLYTEGFEAAGFYRITKKELRNGDVILGKINSPHNLINHGGIYLDNAIDGHGIILHHLPNRLSRREPAGPYINRADLFLRYGDKDANNN